jgi:FkbM family methyltransferase
MLENILDKYKNKISGIIQVGANTGQELHQLVRYSNNIYLFEPLKSAYSILLEKSVKYKTVKTYNFALGDIYGIETLNVTENNNGASSSMLKPTLHKEYFPEIQFNTLEEVIINRFDQINENFDANFLIIDVQGFELKVLKGFGRKLKNIEFILTEYSLEPLYEDSVLIYDLDDFLNKHGFIRYKTFPTSNKPQGDAFYKRKEGGNSFRYFVYKLNSKFQISKLYLFYILLKDPKKLKYLTKKIIKKALNM